MGRSRGAVIGGERGLGGRLEKFRELEGEWLVNFQGF